VSVRLINLEAVVRDATVEKVRDDYIARFGPKSGKGLYYWQDWARFNYVLPLLPHGKRALDVGVFTGQFFDSMTLSGKFQHVTGIDVVRKPNFYTITDEPDIREMNVAHLEFVDNSFDTVVCMEVIEHVDSHDYESSLSELRRVSAQYLLISVPFNEREPISANHRRRFTPDDMLHVFPQANYTLLYDPQQKLFIWALIEELPQAPPSLAARAKGFMARRAAKKVLERAARDPVGLARDANLI